jgi:hypothetical protein
LLSIASQNIKDYSPILDDDQLNIELNMERSNDTKSDYVKLHKIVEMAEKEMPRNAEV